MQGKEVFKHAVERLFHGTRQCLDDHGVPISSVDWVVPHQANVRILDQVAKMLGVPERKMIKTLKTHANTSAASIPLALHSAIERRQIHPTHRLLLKAFGAGFTWGVSVVDF